MPPRWNGPGLGTGEGAGEEWKKGRDEEVLRTAPLLFLELLGGWGYPSKGCQYLCKKNAYFSVHFGTHSSPDQGWVFFGQLPSLVTCLPSFSWSF